MGEAEYQYMAVYEFESEATYQRSSPGTWRS